MFRRHASCSSKAEGQRYRVRRAHFPVTPPQAHISKGTALCTQGQNTACKCWYMGGEHGKNRPPKSSQCVWIMDFQWEHWDVPRNKRWQIAWWVIGTAAKPWRATKHFRLRGLQTSQVVTAPQLHGLLWPGTPAGASKTTWAISGVSFVNSAPTLNVSRKNRSLTLESVIIHLQDQSIHRKVPAPEGAHE